MRNYPCILLPYHGNPVDKVWLPRDRNVQGLRVTVHNSDMTGSGQEKAKTLGLPSPEVLVLGAFQQMVALVVQVASNQTLKGLQAVPISRIRRHKLFGSIVEAIQATQVK